MTCKSIDSSAAKFLREGRQISQIAIADVVDGCNSLCNQALKEYQMKIKSDLVSAGVNCSIPPLIDSLSVNVDLFKRVKNNYLFEKFCMEHFGCLVSSYS